MILFTYSLVMQRNFFTDFKRQVLDLCEAPGTN